MYYQLKHSEGFSSRVWHINVLIMLMLMLCSKPLCGQSSLSPLHVDGPFLVNAEGRRVNLHGFAQTFSPWFNEQGTKWTNYDVNKCLSYNKGIIDGIMNAGWKMTFVRQHMDPYWSNTPGKQTTGENDISAFDFERFKTNLDRVFIPMAEYAIQKGLYVVMRPPGVCPENIQIGDDYHQYLKKVWGYVAQHPKLKDNGAVLFELANEPVHINNGTRDRDEAMTQYMQEIVDLMRQYCNNILLIPGLGWQSNYAGFAKHPIKGENIGYAVHCYPGWYNSGHEGEVHTSYREFKRGWESQIGPVAEMAPVVVTEMDWGPKKYSPSHKDANGNEVFDTRCSFAFAYTGTAGGEGFGANFRRIVDETCNVSWLLFTGAEILAQYNDAAPDGQTFLTDPEACPRPCYRWYQEYATQAYSDKINDPGYGYHYEEEPLFSLTEEWLNPSIIGTGSFNESTGALTTGQYGFGGWQFAGGADISAHKYLVIELKQAQTAGAVFRMFDVNTPWGAHTQSEFGSNQKLVLDLHNLKVYNDNSGNMTDANRNLDPSHVYYAGIWSYGSSPIYINKVFLSDDGVNPTGILELGNGTFDEISREYYSLDGRRLASPQAGVNIVKVTKNNGKTRIFKVCYKI